MPLGTLNGLSANASSPRATGSALTATLMVCAALKLRAFRQRMWASVTPIPARLPRERFSASGIIESSTTGERMPSTYRCSRCSHNWPHGVDYRICPQCGQSCWIDYSGIPMDPEEARALKNELEFERFYEAHERKQIEAAAAEIADLPETTEPKSSGLRMRWTS